MKSKLNKSFGLTLVLFVLIAISGCERGMLEVLDKDKYTSLYIPQANATPNYKNLYLKEDEQTFSLSIYMGGVNAPKQDIRIKVGFTPEMAANFNTEKGTNYQVMPQGSYVFENNEAVIAAGQPHSSDITIKVKTVGHIEAFVPYLLPVTITNVSDGTPVNPKLSTVYFLVTGSFEAGHIPTEKVFQLLGGNQRSIFKYYDNLITQGVSGEMRLYPYNTTDQKFGTSRIINTGWDGFDTVMPVGNRWIVRWGSWTGGNNGFLNSYSVASDGVIEGLNVGWFSGGFQIFDLMIPYRGSLLCRLPTGEIRRYPLDQNYNFGTSSSLGLGWNDFTQILPYKNTLLCIDNAGDMWEYPVTELGVVASRRKVGSGWDMYSRVVPFGDDLLGIDAENAVYRYKFNPIGFWALK